MRSIVIALVWEQLWKNRIVFPVLLLLFALAAGLSEAILRAPPEAWWVSNARGGVVISFLASLLIGYAPFTLMESHRGWRMNSMVTRWFVLPVRTPTLVLVPLATSLAVLVLLMFGWSLLIGRLVRDIDTRYLTALILAGASIAQALAWLLARKPTQFWPLLALLLPALFLAVVLQDSPRWSAIRPYLTYGALAVVPGAAVFSLAVAARTRSGVWTGELPLRRLLNWCWRLQPRTPAVRSPRSALFWSDVFPALRGFALTWLATSVMIVGMQLVLTLLHRPEEVLNLRRVAQVILFILPGLAVLWLPVGGLLLGCEPGLGFRTRLTGFRAVRPVSAGLLAGERLAGALLIWVFTWVPMLLLRALYDADYAAGGGTGLQEYYASMGRALAASASALIGALPLLLWGRWEGFPNMLLTAMACWAGTWMLSGAFSPANEAPPPSAVYAIILLALKFAAAVTGLGLAARGGHITWRFPVWLIGGWMAAAGALIWGLPIWSAHGLAGALYVLLLLPLARLSFCPLAVAANRHR